MFFKSSTYFSTPEFLDHINQHLTLDSLRILMIGDVVGQAGRSVLRQTLPSLKARAQINFVTINGENLAGGFGISLKTFQEVLDMGVDCVTMGNHWKDKSDIHTLRKDPRLVMPHNLKDVMDIEEPRSFTLPGTHKTLTVVNLMGLFAMKDEYLNPFVWIQKYEQRFKNEAATGSHILILDFHGETASEKQAVTRYLNGTLNALIGTHTHLPACDERITPEGTAFLSDVGMTGAYDSIIGMDTERSLRRYFPPVEKKPQEVAKKDKWLCGFLVEVDPKTCRSITGHRLQYRQDLESWTISSVSLEK